MKKGGLELILPLVLFFLSLFSCVYAYPVDFVNGDFESGNLTDYGYSYWTGGDYCWLDPSNVSISDNSYEGDWSVYLFSQHCRHCACGDSPCTCICTPTTTHIYQTVDLATDSVLYFYVNANATWAVFMDSVAVAPLLSGNTNGVWESHSINLENYSGVHSLVFATIDSSGTGGRFNYCEDGSPATAYYDNIHISNQTNDIMPDLYINPEDIHFSQDLPKRGETVVITATIHNSNATDAYNVSVEFNDTLTNTTLGWQTIPFIAANGSANESIEWPITNGTALGPRNISVKIRLDDMPQETDGNESNNQAEKEIKVVTKRVLVVLTYFNDENMGDIQSYEGRINSSIHDITDYFLAPSYTQEYIGFSTPLYEKMPYDAIVYINNPFNLVPDNYAPTSRYARDVLSTLSGYDIDIYDSVLAYQTLKAANDSGKSKFREVTYYLSKPVAVVFGNNSYLNAAHELGHALYNFNDFYGSFGNRGDVGEWDLMGRNGRQIMSFNRVAANWSYYQNIQGSHLGYQQFFKLKALEKTNVSDTFVKISGLSKYTAGSSDLILESREHSPQGLEGVVIYEDSHDLSGSFLRNLKTQEQISISDELPKLLPTISDRYNTYRYIPSGLKFEYLGDNNSDPNVYSPIVKVSFDVFGNLNLTGIELDVDLSQFPSSSFSSPSDVEVDGFKNIVLVPDIRFINQSLFEVYLSNNYNQSVRINSINLTNLVTDEVCYLNLSLPFNVTKFKDFTVKAYDCLSSTNELQELGVVISYDIISPDGVVSASNLSESGKITFIRTDQKANLPIPYSGIIFYIPLIVLFVIGSISILKYRHNKKIMLFWIIIVLLLICSFIWLFSITKFGDSSNDSNKKSWNGRPSSVNLTYPYPNLHAYTSDGLHTGMNYTTGVYENQIPGAITSGDMVAEEWIFVPSNLSVHFVVDSHDVQQYLNEINSTEKLTLNYSIQQMVYGPNPSVEFVNYSVVILDRTVSEPINGSIGPGEQVVYWPSTTTTSTTTTSTTTTTLPPSILSCNVNASSIYVGESVRLSQNVSVGTYPVDNAVFELNHNTNHSYTGVLGGLYEYDLSTIDLVGNNSLMCYVNDSLGNNVWSAGGVFVVSPTSTTSATTTTSTSTTITTTTTTTSGTTTSTVSGTCFDGVKNNSETGVDCGSACENTCCSYSSTCGGGGLCCKKVYHSTGVCCAQGHSCSTVVGQPYCG
jgi:hypothetical protein